MVSSAGDIIIFREMEKILLDSKKTITNNLNDHYFLEISRNKDVKNCNLCVNFYLVQKKGLKIKKLVCKMMKLLVFLENNQKKNYLSTHRLNRSLSKIAKKYLTVSFKRSSNSLLQSRKNAQSPLLKKNDFGKNCNDLNISISKLPKKSRLWMTKGKNLAWQFFNVTKKLNNSPMDIIVPNIKKNNLGVYLGTIISLIRVASKIRGSFSHYTYNLTSSGILKKLKIYQKLSKIAYFRLFLSKKISILYNIGWKRFFYKQESKIKFGIKRKIQQSIQCRIFNKKLPVNFISNLKKNATNFYTKKNRLTEFSIYWFDLIRNKKKAKDYPKLRKLDLIEIRKEKMGFKDNKINEIILFSSLISLAKKNTILENEVWKSKINENWYNKRLLEIKSMEKDLITFTLQNNEIYEKKFK